MDIPKCLRLVLLGLAFTASTGSAAHANEVGDTFVFADDANPATEISTASPIVTTVSNPAVDVLRRSPIEPGRHGGAEFAGALVLTGLLLRAAYRRGII